MWASYNIDVFQWSTYIFQTRSFYFEYSLSFQINLFQIQILSFKHKSTTLKLITVYVCIHITTYTHTK